MAKTCWKLARGCGGSTIGKQGRLLFAFLQCGMLAQFTGIGAREGALSYVAAHCFC